MDDRTVDRIFAGSLESLPPVSSKIVRIFTSSTFTDTSLERNTLMAQVYPKLKDFCREKHGLEFQVVDMRWGVRDEATDDHMTTELCMKEIENCQRLSMGPNFVVFLGQKYGYRPIPTYILASELQMIRDTLVSMGTDVSLLDMWYKKDSNAVPPVCILQPISSILVNFNNKRVPKLQQEDQGKWWDTLEKMQKMLRKAALALFNQGSMDHEAMHNYFMSVTEREVINGILNVKNTKNHCLAYVRYINNINLQNLRRAGLFIDIANRAVDSEAVRLLANLRDERLPAKIETTNLQRYTVDWIGRDGLGSDTHEEYLQNFIGHFYRNIARLVDRAMRKEDSSPQGQIVTEILQHLHACNNSVKVFYGREKDLERVQRYIVGSSTEPLVLYGVGGCGKTSLLAKSASLIIPWLETATIKNEEGDTTTTDDTLLEGSENGLSRTASTHRDSISSGSQGSSVKRRESLSGVQSAASTISKGSALVASRSKSNSKNIATSSKKQKPVLIARFLGTTPDSSALTPLLISLCQQISYNYMIPFDSIPDDLVPLTAYFKQLLNLASAEQPLLLFLDSVDQLGGTQDANKMAWLPTRLPPHCKIVVSCVSEPENPEISRDYQILRRMISSEDNFIQVLALGESLALQVIKQWMRNSKRDLTNYQWRVVSNAMARCSLPIFVKLVFAEICRWKSYSRPQETHLASNVMDSIMMLFERIEIQHGRILVFHALAYITASKSGLSETELEDLLSLDDRILDDVYQYHLPPVRRIPPLLWTRIRNDLPNYLSEREADGVSVLNWYHRQFKEAAKERYFKNQNMAIYFHSCIAEYFMGTWGGGNPKPFKYTEIQRMRFNLTEKEGEADRKVPLQPLVFYGKDGSVSRYNLRKFGELPYHLVRARRLDDLYNYVIFNYQWLHAKLASCPLQAVLSDFEDTCNNLEDREMSREIMLVADALRLGGAILTQYPDMLASQLIGRLLPEAPANPHVRKLLEQCDKEGIHHCALMPIAHCLHTPGGPLKYSLEGHQFAVFGFCLTSDARYIVSVSNKFLIWDLSTSDLTRSVAPGIEGVFQGLVLSPDDKFAAAWTNNSQTLILNLLTSETVLVNNPLTEDIKGAFLLDTRCVLYGHKSWAVLSLHGTVLSNQNLQSESCILHMDFETLNDSHIILWSGNLEDKRLSIQSQMCGQDFGVDSLHGAFVMDKKRKTLYASMDNGQTLTIFTLINDEGNVPAKKGTLQRQVTVYDEVSLGSVSHWRWEKVWSSPIGEPQLQLKLCENESHLLGTSALGFCVWNITEQCLGKGLELKLPPGVRNISVKIGCSNSVVLSKGNEFAVAGVRKNLYVWGARNGQLLKTLDAHFGRILAVAPYTTGPWNSVITSSIDRTVKVWNLNNIFEQVHVIDRHELQIDSISLSKRAGIAVTVTRGCVGVWDLRTGKLLDKLAYNALGAIVTHAQVTNDGKYIVASESGSILIWDWASRKAVFQTEQPCVQQIAFTDNDTRFLAASKLSKSTSEASAVIVVRDCPSGTPYFEIEVPIKTFRAAVLTNDYLQMVVMGHEKNRDYLFVFQAQTGILLHKILAKYQGAKECSGLVTIPGKATQIALLDQDKGVVFDVRTKRHVRTIRRWSGKVTKDGRLGLYAPSRGGLELVEMRTSSTVQPLIARTAEGVFSNVAMFNRTDEYVLYYHSGHKTLRIFRVSDGKMLANFRLSAELSALETTEDGLCVVAGTVDGCLSVLCIADPQNPKVGEFLASLPSRRPQASSLNSLTIGSLGASRPGSSSTAKNHLSFKTAATVAAAWAQTTTSHRPASSSHLNISAAAEAEAVSQACVLS